MLGLREERACRLPELQTTASQVLPRSNELFTVFRISFLEEVDASTWQIFLHSHFIYHSLFILQIAVHLLYSNLVSTMFSPPKIADIKQPLAFLGCPSLIPLR